MFMKQLTSLFVLVLAVTATGCASNVNFIQTDDTYEPHRKPREAVVVFRHDRIERPHRVIGIIEAELDRYARRPELDDLMIRKAHEIGADGVMLVEYDVNRDVYIEHHHHVVGRGPWRHHVVTSHPRSHVKKTASGVAVVFLD